VLVVLAGRVSALVAQTVLIPFFLPLLQRAAENQTQQAEAVVAQVLAMRQVQAQQIKVMLVALLTTRVVPTRKQAAVVVLVLSVPQA
jgi:hypothetical protein